MTQVTLSSRSLVLLALLPLAACGGADNVARSIGLVRDAPDEFTVTTRAPLSMPPDYVIRPPSPGAQRPQERTPRQAAEAALAPSSVLAAPAGVSAGQQALLNATGKPAPAGIRNEINRQAVADSQNRELTDRLMFRKDEPQPGVVVDPTAEAKRLRENAALGHSTQSGDTPIIQRGKSSLLDSLF